MYAQDVVAARATDTLIQADVLAKDPRVRGWVVTEDRSAVHFLGEDPVTLLYTVRFGADPSAPPRLERLAPGPPPADVALWFQARQLAARERFARCSDRYNTIVLSGRLAGEDGWLVYLLAATREPGEVVFGGHVRVLVSPAGDSVLRNEPLSRNCLRMSKASAPQGASGLVVTTLVSPCPLETHVFLSLLHRAPIFVGTSTGSWRVEGDEIRFLGPRDR